MGVSDLHVVILAAGKGTRMKSDLPKVLHNLAGRPLIEHVLRTVDQLGAASTVLVVGHGADQVRTALANRPNLQFVVQSPQLGTGHALMQAEPLLSGKAGTVLLLYADVPLLEAGTLRRLVDSHQSTRAAATVLTASLTRSVRLRPHRSRSRRPDRAHRRGARRLGRGAGDSRSQQRHLRAQRRPLFERYTDSRPTTRRASTT